MPGKRHHWTAEQEAEVERRLGAKEAMKAIQQDMQLRWPTLTYNAIILLVKKRDWAHQTRGYVGGRAGTTFIWDPVLLDEPLRLGRAAGESFEKVLAERLKPLAPTCTRAAVLTRIKELDLKRAAKTPSPKPKAVRRRARGNIERKPRVKKAKQPTKKELFVIKHMPKPDAKLRRRCQYPIGEPGQLGFRFCEEPCERTYCAEHAAICYVMK